MFSSWSDIWRVVGVTSVIFIFIVAVMRLMGPQALARMSAFDMVFTVTLGSIIATAGVTRDITIAEAIAAIVCLLILQEIFRFLQSRSLKAHHLVRQPPRVVLWAGQLLDDRLKSNSISADEVRAAVRGAGIASLSEVQAVVLENDGEWSVVPKNDKGGDNSAFYGLPIPGEPDNSPKTSGDDARPTSNFRLP